MYKHSTISKSWSSLFGHAIEDQSAVINNENTTEIELTRQDQVDALIEEQLKNQFEDNSTVGKRLSFRAFKDNISQSKKNFKNTDDIIHISSDFGNDQREIEEILFPLNTNSEPTTAEPTVLYTDASCSSATSSSKESVMEYNNAVIKEKSYIFSGSGSKSSSPLRVRERLSNVFTRYKKITPDSTSAFPPSSLPGSTHSSGCDVEKKSELSTPLPKLLKKKSSLKFSKILNTFEGLESDLLDSNPNLEGLQLFPTKKAYHQKLGLEPESKMLPFPWSSWQKTDCGLRKDLMLETVGEANQFVLSCNDLLYLEESEIHIMRTELTPQRQGKIFNKCGTLEIRICHEGEKRFVIWNFLVHIILSDFLYQKDDIHEPILGLSWHGDAKIPVVSVWLARSHHNRYDSELLEISRICHFLKESLPSEVDDIMEAQNLIYSVSTLQVDSYSQPTNISLQVNETNDLLKIRFA